MANSGTDGRAVSVARSAFVAGFLVSLVICLRCPPPPPVSMIVSLESVKRPPVIVPMELYAEPQPPGIIRRLVDALTDRAPNRELSPAVITPPDHPDAQPWPRGMVIHPPPFPDRMAGDIPTALDRVLSGLLGPWSSTSS
jgi:hypothetical protein